MRILLIEDARRMAEAIESILVHHGYAVDVCFDGQSGLEAALYGIYDVIILDIMLPKRDGISVLKELRAERISTPLLLLTAKSQTEDRVDGLDAGADDYLTKPFEMAELLARIRALSRRAPTMSNDAMRLAVGDIQLDVGSFALSSLAENSRDSFTLTRKEAQLMELLMRNVGIALSSQTIIERVWGYDAEAEDSHVQVYISFLRKKMTALKTAVTIKTLRGHGYLLQVDKSEPGADESVEDDADTDEDASDEN